jgi:hypothetical protein
MATIKIEKFKAEPLVVTHHGNGAERTFSAPGAATIESVAVNGENIPEGALPHCVDLSFPGQARFGTAPRLGSKVTITYTPIPTGLHEKAHADKIIADVKAKLG